MSKTKEEEMKKNSLMLVAMVLVLAMAATAWAESGCGWTISRSEAREMVDIVHSVRPDANIEFFCAQDNTRLRVHYWIIQNQNWWITESREKVRIDFDIAISIDGRTSIVGRLGSYGRKIEKEIYDIQSDVQAILDRPAREALK